MKKLTALLCAAADTGFVGVHCEAGDTIRRSVAARLSSGDRRCVYHALTRPGKVEAKAIRRCLALAAEAPELTRPRRSRPAASARSTSLRSSPKMRISRSTVWR